VGEQAIRADTSRRLAAILAADVAGYSRLMGQDEDGTVRALKEHQAVLAPTIAGFGGRVIDMAGDSVLAEFPSVMNAVNCALAIQRSMAERNADVPPGRRMEFRIGLNLGDVLVEDERIYGDGINIAARLEAIAEPGGICIAGRVHEEVARKLGLDCEDLGEQSLKNIAQPVRAWRVRVVAVAASPPVRLALPDKPSIAVLPFTNMSGDPEQEYFADGMVEDIITALSRLGWLFVIARNSSFTYKGKAVDVKHVGRELGVRYVLEGSVRKAGARVRITSQLIDASSGAHLWADRFDGAQEDVFDLQDRVAASVVGAIEPSLRRAELELSRRKPTESLDAYDYLLRALPEWYSASRQGYEAALRLARKAIGLDARFAVAYGLAAQCYVWQGALGWTDDLARDAAEGARLARAALEFGQDDPMALWMGAHALAFLAKDFDVAEAAMDRSLAMNGNSASAFCFSGWLRCYLCRPELALEHFNRARRLSPLDPLHYLVLGGEALAYRLLGRYQESLDVGLKALIANPRWSNTLKTLCAAYAQLGRIEEARAVAAQLLEVNPTFTVSQGISLYRRDPVMQARYAEGLRLAGIPEG
jgi:adenylate cyclase